MKKGILLVLFLYSCAAPATTSSQSAYPSDYPMPSASDATKTTDIAPVAGAYPNYSAVPSAAATTAASSAPSVAPTTAPSNLVNMIPLPSASPSMPNLTNPPIIELTPPNIEDKKTKNNLFTDYKPNNFVETSVDNKSTFSIDTDTASYTWFRKSVENNLFVSPESVRTEEYINYFDYNYEKPINTAFSINTELVNSKFDSNKILKVGIQGKKVDDSNRKNANLFLLIDVSGSMNQDNRLELVKQSLLISAKNLQKGDKVSIITFGNSSKVLVENLSAENLTTIINQINNLKPEGSTNTEDGLNLAFELANKYYSPDSNNRIILCSDGVANTGETDINKLIDKVISYQKKNIFLSTIGFGMGNYNDLLLEKLAYSGGGYYAYVDSLKEANRIFNQNLTGTLQNIAKDTKIQVEFNPNLVESYRLLGYEKRDIPDTDFRDDGKDAAEVGSNQSATAIYEIKLRNNTSNQNSLANIYVRYKDIDNNVKVNEIAKGISINELKDFNLANNDTKLAITVAELAELLKNGNWSRNTSFSNILKSLDSLDKNNEKINELRFLVDKYAKKFN
ncbi:MAG: von Willebrand factor type A domain-containing protein [Candidatus Sericytochromatia bacterium]